MMGGADSDDEDEDDDDDIIRMEEVNNVRPDHDEDVDEEVDNDLMVGINVKSSNDDARSDLSSGDDF